MRGEKTFRTGSGLVSLVYKQTNSTCPCDQCKHSENPRKFWWEIYVDTATHVVFDDTEASHTTFRLFYDSENSPVVILKDNLSIVNANIERDKCKLFCITCDESIGNKLEKMWTHYVNSWKIVNEKYLKARDVERLAFIVSHPHGCSKQISVGQWQDKCQVGDDSNFQQFTYTTCTCPGSSGATVYCVGYYGWRYQHVHGGSLSSGLNYSSVGSVL